MKPTYIICLLGLLLFLNFFYNPKVYAESTGVVKAVVTVSVCGDFVKNGDEECDNDDLGQQTCNDLGYVGGNLSCTSACTFNTLNCSLQSSDSNVLGIADTDTQFVNTALLDSVVRPQPNLPLKLNFYDKDNNGFIEKSEVYFLVDRWNTYVANNNYNLCDLNSDKICDLKDLSFALYYVEK